MARGTIKQRIALDGGAEIRKELLELGRAGEVVWAKLNKLSKQEIVPTAFPVEVLAIKGAFNDVAVAGDKFGKTLPPVRKSADDLGNAFDTMGTKLRNMALGVTAAVVGFGALVKAAADSGDAIGENAQKAGVAAVSLKSCRSLPRRPASAGGFGGGVCQVQPEHDRQPRPGAVAGQALEPVKGAADRIAKGLALPAFPFPACATR
jgi:hypothetical protein